MDWFYSKNEMNLSFSESTQPNLHQKIFVYIPLGKFIRYAKLQSGVRLYGIHKTYSDGDDDGSAFEAYLNLMSPTLNINSNFSRYIQTNFLKNNCLEIGTPHFNPIGAALK